MYTTEISVVSGIEALPGPSKPVTVFLDAWKTARRGGLVPMKRDFDPIAVPRLLPDLWIYHYSRDENIFRCRLSGERINKAWGRSVAGKESEEVLGSADNVQVVAIWKQVLDTPLIHYTKLDRFSENGLYVAERTVVPLCDESGARDFVLGLSLYSLGSAVDVAPPAVTKTAYHIHCSDL